MICDAIWSVTPFLVQIRQYSVPQKDCRVKVLFSPDGGALLTASRERSLLSGDQPPGKDLWEYLESGKEATSSSVYPVCKSLQHGAQEGGGSDGSSQSRCPASFGTLWVTAPSVSPALLTPLFLEPGRTWFSCGWCARLWCCREHCCPD